MKMRAHEPANVEDAGTAMPMMLPPLPDQPLVSVLISNYNYAAYLREAIGSCSLQTYENLEVVICDDGSTDESFEILAGLQSQDRRIKIIHQDNGGQSLALSTAFRKCAGEIICFLDADDVFMPEKVRQVVKAFATAPNSGFAVNRMLRVDRGRKRLGDLPLFSPLASGWIRPSISLAAPHVVRGLPPCSGLSLRRPIAEAIFPLPPGLKAYADTLIQVLAPLITPVAAIETPLSEYRFHGSNVAAVHEFTEDKLRNLVAYEKEIWHAWRRFVASPHMGLSSHWKPPSGMPSSPMANAYARFRSRRESAFIRQAISPEYFQTWPRSLQWYWRATKWMPNWFFRKSFNFVYGQTPAKMIVGRILEALRNAQPRYAWAGDSPGLRKRTGPQELSRVSVAGGTSAAKT